MHSSVNEGEENAPRVLSVVIELALGGKVQRKDGEQPKDDDEETARLLA